MRQTHQQQQKQQQQMQQQQKQEVAAAEAEVTAASSRTHGELPHADVCSCYFHRKPLQRELTASCGSRIKL
jgi:transcription initiation factor TFIID subunit TAF12